MDHLALFIDETWVFRFPKNPEYVREFPNEVRLLNALQSHITLAIPRYELVAADASFGGYRKIPGLPLTKNGYADMTAKERSAVAAQLAEFFTELHSFPVKKAASLGVSYEDPSSYLATLREEYARFVRKRLTTEEHLTAEKILTLSQEYAHQRHTQVMTHNDVRGLHILRSKDARIVGIIDFGDKAIGDPAKDLSALWDVSPSLVRDIHARYDAKDADLLRRSLLLRKRGSISWLAYNAKTASPGEYARAYRQFGRVMKLQVGE